MERSKVVRRGLAFGVLGCGVEVIGLQDIERNKVATRGLGLESLGLGFRLLGCLKGYMASGRGRCYLSPTYLKNS